MPKYHCRQLHGDIIFRQQEIHSAHNAHTFIISIAMWGLLNIIYDQGLQLPQDQIKIIKKNWV